VALNSKRIGQVIVPFCTANVRLNPGWQNRMFRADIRVTARGKMARKKCLHKKLRALENPFVAVRSPVRDAL
jgi:hypothetical protein